LFLAELHALSGNESFRLTALGSIKHALMHLDLIPASNRRGFYGGWIGIAVAAARIGKIFQEDNILEKTRILVDRLRNETEANHEFDISDGNSGTICGLIMLGDLLDDESLLDLAIEYGNELLASAVKSNIGLSWSSLIASNFHNLTGFSQSTKLKQYVVKEGYC
jgi:lantibiotic modifying enzyme